MLKLIYLLLSIAIGHVSYRMLPEKNVEKIFILQMIYKLNRCRTWFCKDLLVMIIPVIYQV